MKKIILAALGLAALSFTSLSWGVPVYTGSAVADFGTNPGPASSNAAGYYVWSDASHKNWSVRWTGNDYGNTTWYDWFGSVVLTSLVDGSVKSVQFELKHPDSVDYAVDYFGSDSSMDFIKFNGYAGPAYDGFDFSIDFHGKSTLLFQLGSNMFSNMTPGPSNQQSMGIFIGKDAVAPLVQVKDCARGSIQRFQAAAVPEPSTLLLMVSSLLGVGASRIRRRKA